MHSKNEAAVRALYDRGLNQWDVSVADEVIGPDFVDHEAPPEVGRGPEAVKKLLLGYREIFPDNRFQIDELIETGDRIITRVTIEATHEGPFVGLPPSGQKVTMRGIDIYRLEGGKIVEHWGAMAMEAFAQLIAASKAHG
jgi:predicted ester cyclase